MIPKGKKISLLRVVALLLVFTVSFFSGKFIADWGMVGTPESTGTTSATQASAELPVNRLNVLLLGIDARPGEKDARTDSMILVSIDRDTKKIAMVSIPRDTMVDIEGHGTNKINAANVYGGADLARQTVEKLLNVQIPYYVKTNFNGFQDIIDTLGGVDIDVEKRMYYPAEHIDLKPGQQRLNGVDALGYVRFRHDALGDIGRTERQQKFLSALAKEMLRARSIIKAPILIPKLMAAVETNLGASDAILIARAASNLDSSNIVTATLPGTFYNYKGISYWKIDDSKSKVVLNDLFQGIKLATIVGPDITVPADKPKVTKPEETPETNPDLNTNPDEQANTGTNSNPGNQDGAYPNQDGNYPGQDGTYPGQDGFNGQQNQNQNPNSGNSGNTGLPPDASTGQTGQNPDWQNPGGQTTEGQIPGSKTQSSQSTGGQTPTGQTSGSQTLINKKPTAPVAPVVPQTPVPDNTSGSTIIQSGNTGTVNITTQG